jgi:glycosyltransferase involved in cell wall biosynthesis
MSVLYISYDGALEPLGESQVVAYLERLAGQYAITLLSFEKPGDLADAGRVEAMRQRLAASGVQWRPLRYHKQPAVLSTVWDVVRGIFVALREARQRPVHIAHARGYVASLIGLAAQRLVGARFVFDMRGFWPDEKVNAGHWRPGSRIYRVAKRCERRFFESADAIVSLTAAGAEAVRDLGYAIRSDAAIEVIPTCTDLRRFSPGPPDPTLAASLGLGRGPVIGCVGTMSSWYLRRPMLDYLAYLMAIFDTLIALAVTHEDHEALRRDAVGAGVPADRLRITRAHFSAMPDHLRLMDLGLFFIKPVFSKKGSAATKLGEFLATGVPVVINDGVGDSGAIVRNGRAGVVLPDTSRGSFEASVDEVKGLLGDRDAPDRCRRTAETWFDLERGIEKYATLYDRLLGESAG